MEGFKSTIRSTYESCVQYLLHQEVHQAVHQLVLLALVVRLLLTVLGCVLDNSNLFEQWKYTDIDYDVYMDATEKVLQGQSPYERITFRYSPVLTWSLALLQQCSTAALWRQLCGKVLFSIFDACIIYEIYAIRTILSLGERRSDIEHSLWWAVNPISAYLCSRGSVDAVSNYTVLLTIRLLLQYRSCDSNNYNAVVLRRWLLFAGLVFGFAVHFRLYPVIYWPAFFLVLLRNDKSPNNKYHTTWLYGFNNAVYFSIATIVSFGFFGILSYYWYGQDYLTHAVLYHLTRLDHRHNFSMQFYPLYLLKSTASSTSFWSSTLPSLQQWSLMLLLVWKGAEQHLVWTLFLQTFIFVTFNKVITGQYFLWFFIFLPILSWNNKYDRNTSSDSLWVVLLWMMALLHWLSNAFQLEMLGQSNHLMVWIASIIFFVANVICILHLIRSKHK